MAPYRVVYRGTLRGQAHQITRYWDTSTLVPDIQAFVDALGLSFENSIDGVTGTVLTWNDMYVSRAETGSLGAPFIPANFPFSGTLSATTTLPNHDAVLLRYNGNSFQYPRQNRNRVGGLDESHIIDGVLSATALTDWLAVANSLSLTVVTEDTWNPILWSEDYQQQSTLISRSVSSVISTQRSRRLGVGA